MQTEGLGDGAVVGKAAVCQTALVGTCGGHTERRQPGKNKSKPLTAGMRGTLFGAGGMPAYAVGALGLEPMQVRQGLAIDREVLTIAAYAGHRQ